MANITFDRRTIELAKKKEGLYSKLREKERNIHPKVGTSVEEIVKLAFYEWANKHKGGKEIVDREWKRFQRTLQRYL
jgi:hypothetical protein